MGSATIAPLNVWKIDPIYIYKYMCVYVCICSLGGGANPSIEVDVMASTFVLEMGLHVVSWGITRRPNQQLFADVLNIKAPK